MFLIVRSRNTVNCYAKCSLAATTWPETGQGPFTNTVRTPTVGNCLGNIYVYVCFHWLGMPQNSPCLEVSHQRKVGPCHPPGMVFDPDRGSNGACPGLDLHAMAFLASAWGLQTAGMPRRLQELKTPEVAFGLTSGAGGQSPGRVGS